MPDLDGALHIEQQQEDSQYFDTQLKREPTTESLRDLVNRAIITISNGEESHTVKPKQKGNKGARILQGSRRILESKPQIIKDEETDIKNILRERTFQLKQRSFDQRRQDQLLPSSSPSLLLNSPLPGSNNKPLPRMKLDGIKAQIDNMKLKFGSSGYDDIPSPKSEDWFKTEGANSALDLVLKVQGRSLPSGPRKKSQRHINFLEKGVDVMGRKLGAIKTRSGSLKCPSGIARRPSKTRIASLTANSSKPDSHPFVSSPELIATPLSATAVTPSFDDDHLSSSMTSLSSCSNVPRHSVSLEEYRNRIKCVEVPDAIWENDEAPSNSTPEPSQRCPSHAHPGEQDLPPMQACGPALQTHSDTTDETEIRQPVKPGTNHRIPLSIVTLNSTVPSFATSGHKCGMELDTKTSSRTRGSSSPCNVGDQLTIFVSSPEHLVQPLRPGNLAELPLEHHLSPNTNSGINSYMLDRQGIQTIESSLFTISSCNTSEPASVFNTESTSSGGHEAAIMPLNAMDESTLTQERISKIDRKGKGPMYHHRADSTSHAPLFTNRVINYSQRKLSKHLSSRVLGRDTRPSRRKRHSHDEYEADVLEVYREALEDDCLSPSSRDSILAGARPATAVKLETDVLIQNEGGIAFCGRMKFNERFRYKPWQTIRMVKRYETPGEWDSPYSDEPARPKLVQTQYTPLTFPLPTPQWRWVTDFEVDYRGRSVDANGWEYFDICHHRWKGHPSGFRTFTRRRRWVRTRAKDLFQLTNELRKLNQETSAGQSQSLIRQADENSNDSQLSDGTDDVAPMSSRLQLMILKLKRVGNDQVMRVARSGSMDGHSSLPRTQPFSIVGEGGQLDYHNPFFSYKKLVHDFKHLVKLEGYKFPLGNLLELSAVSSGLPKASSSENDTWNEDELVEHIGGPWKDKLASINLSRVLKVLLEFESERQKIQIWRYWLGVDTYEQDGPIDRPDPEDVWQVVENHLDEILQLFIYQNSRYHFLHMISMLYRRAHPRQKSPQCDAQLPECLSPIVCSRAAPNRRVEAALGQTIDNSILDMDHDRGRMSFDFIGLHAQSRFSYWNDVSNLLNTFNWKLNDEIDLKAKVANEIRIELRRLAKLSVKKWTKQGKR